MQRFEESGQRNGATDSNNEELCNASVTEENELCVMAQVERKKEASETMATKGEPSIITRVEESEEGTSETKKEKIWVSWQPSSSEGGSDSERE